MKRALIVGFMAASGCAAVQPRPGAELVVISREKPEGCSMVAALRAKGINSNPKVAEEDAITLLKNEAVDRGVTRVRLDARSFSFEPESGKTVVVMSGAAYVCNQPSAGSL